MVSVLVTGANGFVGQHVVARLQKEYTVSCLVRNRNYTNPKSKVIYFDGYTDASIEKAISQNDVIVHIAAMLHGRKKDMHNANVVFTKYLVKLAKKHRKKHFIFISSENVEQKGIDVYTRTKEAAEKEVKTFKNYTILRPTVIYGLGDTKYVTRLINIMKKNPVIPILGTGNNTFQFVHVDDICAVVQSAIQNKIYGTHVIAGPDVLSYKDFVKLLMKKLKIKKPVVHVPLSVLKPVAHILDVMMTFPPITPGQISNLAKNRRYLITKTVKLFKYKPTKIEKGLSELLKK